ncbi:MAG: hypothetical protein HUU55_17585 [Myxococcales bacterium]|nr:hypothetical protein [Myxococcales bacterium]
MAMMFPRKLGLAAWIYVGLFFFGVACGRPHSDDIISPVPSPTGQGGEFGSGSDSGGGVVQEPDFGLGNVDNGFADAVAGGGANDGDAAPEADDSKSADDTSAYLDTTSDGGSDTVEPDAVGDLDVADGGGCQPNCADKQCGGDGCGGTCGQCGAGSSCAAGKCILDISYCVQECDSAKDCASSQSPGPYDASHYKCVDNGCEYLGCQSHLECTELYAGLPALCDDTAIGMPLCALACTTPADCVFAGDGGAYDVDNYSCDAGICRYVGCHTDKECLSSLPDTEAGCDLSLQIPLCKSECQTNKDCAQTHSAYDADNYVCENGLCTYIGCHTDDECDGLGAGPWVCRKWKVPGN